MNNQLSTPIKKLKSSNIDNLIRNVETNIKSSRDYNGYVPLKPDSVYQQSNFEMLTNVHEANTKDSEIESEKIEKKNNYKFQIGKLKEYIIILLLFVLLAHPKINIILNKFIPFFNENQPVIYGLLIKGLIFTLLIFILKFVI